MEENLNSSYNFYYNRRALPITFSPHAFDRKEYWALDIDKIEATVRSGELYYEKCEKLNKICFRKYFGKENRTYIVITGVHMEFIEVKTAWSKNGR